MSKVVQDYWYTKTHEWVQIDKEGFLLIGITDYAQALLGDLVYVRLPEIGEQVEQAKEVAVLESVKAAADVYAPLSGEVIAVNLKLKEAPELINQDPYEQGWLFKLKCPHLLTEQLLSATDYQQIVDASV